MCVRSTSNSDQTLEGGRVSSHTLPCMGVYWIWKHLPSSMVKFTRKILLASVFSSMPFFQLMLLRGEESDKIAKLRHGLENFVYDWKNTHNRILSFCLSSFVGFPHRRHWKPLTWHLGVWEAADLPGCYAWLPARWATQNSTSVFLLISYIFLLLSPIWHLLCYLQFINVYFLLMYLLTSPYQIVFLVLQDI